MVDPKELDDSELVSCVLNDDVVDDEVDSPLCDSWELDHVLLIDDGPEVLDN